MAYRQHASQTSPTLDQLAERARTARAEGRIDATPEDACMLVRQELAVGVHHDRGAFGLLAALNWFGVLACLHAVVAPEGLSPTGQLLFPIFVVLAIVTTVAWQVSSRNATRRRAAAIEQELAWAVARPFPVTGYATWLASSAPTITVTLSRTVDRTVFAEAARAICPDIRTTVIDGRTFCLELPARSELINRTTHRFGDVPLARRLFEQLSPLHDEVGIEGVAMGGAL